MQNYTYSILLQRTNAVDNAKDDKKFFDDFHSVLNGLIETERNEKKKGDSESVQRAIARLRGSLIPYLSTPLKSDKDDIERSIKDTIDDVLNQIDSSSNASNVKIESYAVLDPSQIQLHRQLVGVIKRLLKNGKAMLADAGITTGKNYGTVFLSYCSFEGFSTVTIVHDSVAKIMKNGNMNTHLILNDTLNERVAAYSDENVDEGTVISLHFDAEETVVEKLKVKLPGLLKQFGIQCVRLNRHSFFSGFGTEYQLQIVTNLKKHPLGTILLALIDDDPELEEALTEQGSLIALQKLT